MGGLGSGSWLRWNSRGYLGDNISIDIRHFKREGLLVPGSSFLLRRSVNGVTKSKLQVLAKKDSIVLKYSYRINNGDWSDIKQPVHLMYTDCNYGGERVWFKCPKCNLRVAKLFLQNPYFICRHCCKLSYRSQSESVSDRSHRKSVAIKEKLKFDSKRMLPIAYIPKPKGMHWKTFNKLRLQGMKAEQVYLAYFKEQLDKIRGGLE